MPIWKKAFLSPLAAMPCEACGAELRVTWKSYLKAIALGSIIFLLGYLQFEEGSLNQYLTFGVGFVLMLAGQIYFMPIGLDKAAGLDKAGGLDKSEASDEPSEKDPS
jgi:hypothetical protein